MEPTAGISAENRRHGIRWNLKTLFLAMAVVASWLGWHIQSRPIRRLVEENYKMSELACEPGTIGPEWYVARTEMASKFGGVACSVVLPKGGDYSLRLALEGITMDAGTQRPVEFPASFVQVCELQPGVHMLELLTNPLPDGAVEIMLYCNGQLVFEERTVAGWRPTGGMYVPSSHWQGHVAKPFPLLCWLSHTNEPSNGVLIWVDSPRPQ